MAVTPGARQGKEERMGRGGNPPAVEYQVCDRIILRNQGFRMQDPGYIAYMVVHW